MTELSQVELGLKAFDRSILLHQAMGDQTLADEVLGLFLQQLAILKSKDWARLDLNFEMHTLKGSAAALGALQLEAIARQWHDIGPQLQSQVLQAVARFEAAAK